MRPIKANIRRVGIRGNGGKSLSSSHCTYSPKELPCNAHFPKLTLVLTTAILPPRFAQMSLPDSGRRQVGDLEVFHKPGSSVAITGALEGGSQSSASESEVSGARG